MRQGLRARKITNPTKHQWHARGLFGSRLGDPLIVVSDGAPGIIRAIEECFPRSARQRCLAHRMRNLAVKVPTDLWPEFKAVRPPAIRLHHAPSPATSPTGCGQTTPAFCRVRSPA